MKKNILPSRTETKPAKKLFGVSETELKAVHGGGGVIGNSQNPAPGTGGSSGG
ncbi:MAG TPA: hypothetical protein VL463_25235 [Kofleriaceae bacterium]|jgi:hypothetical protein|nr:hypothetical protein [Kofleriaceae bacterium]